MRRTFIVYYRDGVTRMGTLYPQSNVMMDDGELFARIDQLITDSVLRIRFL